MIDVIAGADQEARQLMESVQREGGSLGEEYPLVFDERFDGGSVAVGEAGHVISACTILAREFRIGRHTARGGMIGSVSTSPAERGRGLATRTLIEAEALLQTRGCAFVLLWGEDPSFYVTRGYCPAGVEYDFVITAEDAKSLPESSSVRALESSDVTAVRALYHEHSARVERTDDEMRAMLECPGMSSLVIERDGAIVAYALRGRGQDLQAAIHEWGGDVEDVLALVRAHVEALASDDFQGLVLMAPETATELRVRMASMGIPEHVGILGLGKILDRSATARLLDEMLGEDCTCEVVPTEEGERFRIEGPIESGLVDDDGALALLLPTVELRPAVEEFLARFGLQQTELPMTPFVWGLDSI